MTGLRYVGALVGASPAAPVAGPSVGATVVVDEASTVTADDGTAGGPVDPVVVLGAGGSDPVPRLVDGPGVVIVLDGEAVVELGLRASATVVSLTRVVVVVVVGKYSGASNPRMIPRPSGCGTTSA